MTDKELDRILHQALTPEIRVEDIKIKSDNICEENQVKGVKNMRMNKIFKPVAAVAACAAIVAVVGSGTLGHIVGGNDTSISSTANPVQQLVNGYSVVVKAAEGKKLEKGVEAILSKDKKGGSAWGGDDAKRTVSYCIDFPVSCKGNNIKTVTYEINDGAFVIQNPVGKSNLLDYVKGPKELDTPSISYYDKKKKEYESTCCTSFTIAADKQDVKNQYISISGGERAVSKDQYDVMFGDKYDVDKEAEVTSNILKNVEITCTITYKDGTTDHFKCAVGTKAVSYLSLANVGKNNPKAENKFLVSTITMK